MGRLFYKDLSFMHNGIAHDLALVTTLTVVIENWPIFTIQLGKKVPFLHWEQGHSAAPLLENREP
jgi:hypothetical protein